MKGPCTAWLTWHWAISGSLPSLEGALIIPQISSCHSSGHIFREEKEGGDGLGGRTRGL